MVPEIPEALHIPLNAPEDAGIPRLLHRSTELLGHIVLPGADNGVGFGGFQPVDIILHREHMGGRNGGDPQLVQSNHGEPVFIVALQHQHHPVPPLQPRLSKHVGHPVAAAADLVEGEDMLLVFRVAPDHGSLVRGLIRHHIHHVVGKVEILRIVQGNFFQSAPFIQDLPAILLINAHICSLSLQAAGTDPAESVIPLAHQVRVRIQSFQFLRQLFPQTLVEGLFAQIFF